jgi:hypothetical protein
VFALALSLLDRAFVSAVCACCSSSVYRGVLRLDGFMYCPTPSKGDGVATPGSK